jgi:hypothetical protein
LVITLLAAVLFCFNTTSQSRWIQHYMDNNNAPVVDLDVAYDNGYFLSGWITPNYPPFSWLIKTDINGEILWQKLIGGVDNNIGVSYISQNGSGDLYLCGAVGNNDGFDPIIIKLNACGEKEWCRDISTFSKYDFFWDCVCTYDGGCAALIYGAYTLTYNRAGILKFSSTGELLWQQYYQSEDLGVIDPELSDLIITPDRGFLMTGFCFYPDPEHPEIGWLHPYYIKTDSLGNFEWETIVHKETGAIGGDAFMSLVNPKQTYYYSCISHEYTSDTLYTTRPAMVKLDMQGNVMGVYDLVHGNYDLGKIMTFDFLNDSLLVGSAGWGDEDGPYQSRAIIFDTLGHITDSVTIINDPALGYTKTTPDNKIVILIGDHSSGQFHPTLFKLTQNLEQDTFYTTPFTYDSLCPYQIAWDTIVPDDCGVIVGIEEQGGMEAWGHGGMEIWPNPASGIVDCRWSNFDYRGDLTLMIYDLFGREIGKFSVPATENYVQFNVEDLTPGLYLAVFKDGSHIIGSAKLMVTR